MICFEIRPKVEAGMKKHIDNLEKMF